MIVQLQAIANVNLKIEASLTAESKLVNLITSSVECLYTTVGKSSHLLNRVDCIVTIEMIPCTAISRSSYPADRKTLEEVLLTETL